MTTCTRQFVGGLSAAIAVVLLMAAAEAAQNAHKIVVRVNGDPITNLDIKQRANLIMMSAPDIQSKVRARAKRSFKTGDIQQRFRAFLKKKNPQSREEAKALQKQFSQRVIQNARSAVRDGLRSRALSELIDDRLKTQEAKKRGVLLATDELDEVIGGMAKRNKMTVPQFKKFLNRQGVHINTLKAQMRARLSWQRVAGARLRRQVQVRNSDIEFALAADPAADRGKATEFDLRRITLASKKAFDTAQFERAQGLRAKFTSCKNVSSLAKSTEGAKFTNMGKTRAGTLPDNARPLLLATPVGKMAPPVFTSRGVALYAVCDRKEVDSDDKRRKTTKQKLQNKQMTALARRLLKDLCQEAYIEPPVTSGPKARCGES
ncbi:MAG: SurA N-terminal domain-containing protein [Hyphomicrobiaceae bacterium]